MGQSALGEKKQGGFDIEISSHRVRLSDWNGSGDIHKRHNVTEAKSAKNL